MLRRAVGLSGAALFALVAVGASAADQADWSTRAVARGGDISEKVAKLRGLRIKRPSAMGVVDDAQLRARILQRLDEDSPPAERAAEAAMMKRWGLVPWNTDLDRLIVDLLTEQIAGFYDPTEKKLYVAAKPEGDATWADMLMAHEIVHALQDQHFDLETWMKVVEHDGDASAARAALVEGDGVALMLEYTLAEQGLPPPWNVPGMVRLLSSGMTTSDAGGDQFARAPLAIRNGLMFPYLRGLEFVAHLRRTQPWKKVDDAFRRPPRSTEQILHPELYLADEKPHAITAAVPGGWVKVHDAVWGEHGWSTFFEAHGVDPRNAASAAAGWGGDRVVLLARDGDAGAVASPARTTGVAVISFDTDLDAAEAWQTLSHALDALVVGAEIATAIDQRRWIDADGRHTVAERRGAAIAIVTGAPLTAWRPLLDGAWGWRGIPAPTPASP
jgi:hypothetical protein